jgi:flagellar hook-associated protein 3
MMINKFLTESNDALGRLSKYQSQVDTTKRITNIADDPQGTLVALKARNKLSNLEQYKLNISTASGYLKEAESATTELNEVLKSAYDDIISAQSGSKTADDQRIIAEDLKNLRDEILSISNTTLGTSYIFGGYNYTGKISGGTKTPPFTADSVTGDLTYNGINVSQFAWKDEYDNAADKLTELKGTLTGFASAFTTSSADSYNKSQAQSAAEALSSIVSKTKEALDDATRFGINPSSANFTALKTFYDNISAVSTELSAEASRDLAGDYILDTAATVFKSDGSIDYDHYSESGISVYTADELANKFSSQSVYDVFNTVTAQRPNTVMSLFSGAPSSMDTVVANLAGDLTSAVSAAQPLITSETTKVTKLQIGTSQTVDVTMTGLQLLGTGSDNIYHVLGKAIDMLNKGAGADELAPLLTEIQNAQSSVLTLQTKIGATQNRMTMISNRYVSNELNYTEMKSNVEDADMAESIMNLTTAQTVYNAALAGGAEIIKTSLLDFLR